jgi:hypothetical protein
MGFLDWRFYMVDVFSNKVNIYNVSAKKFGYKPNILVVIFIQERGLYSFTLLFDIRKRPLMSER